MFNKGINKLENILNWGDPLAGSVIIMAKYSNTGER